MNFDLKSHLFNLASSTQVKSIVCDLIDDYVTQSDNDIDDAMARGIRAALLGTDEKDDA